MFACQLTWLCLAATCPCPNRSARCGCVMEMPTACSSARVGVVALLHSVEEVSPHACSVHVCAQGSTGCTFAREMLLPQLRLGWGQPSRPSIRLAFLGRKRNLEDKDPAARPASWGSNYREGGSVPPPPRRARAAGLHREESLQKQPV